jgi:hypothetical protein
MAAPLQCCLRCHNRSIGADLGRQQPGLHRMGPETRDLEPVHAVQPMLLGLLDRSGGSFLLSVAVKALKVTIVLDPRVLRPAPAGADVVLEVTTEGGLAARARLNPKSYRKALDAIREQGPDNVAVILQGRVVTLGEIIDAGISALPKQKA